MIRRIVKHSEYEHTPYLAWNACVDVIAMESLDNLSEIQRHAHFVFAWNRTIQFALCGYSKTERSCTCSSEFKFKTRMVVRPIEVLPTMQASSRRK